MNTLQEILEKPQPELKTTIHLYSNSPDVIYAVVTGDQTALSYRDSEEEQADYDTICTTIERIQETAHIYGFYYVICADEERTRVELIRVG